MSDDAAAAGRVGVLWRNRDFMKFWAGQSLSLIGTQMTVLALPLTAIFALRADAGQLGVLRAAQFLPFLLLSLPFGLWIDRIRRRPTMIVSDLARGLLIGLIPLLALTDQLRIGQLYAITFAIGLFTVLFDLSYLSYVPSLLRRETLVEGNSKLQTSISVAEIGGPGLGGLLVQALTAPVALIVDAVSYLASAAGVAWIRKPEPAPERPERSESIPAQLAVGLRYVFGNSYLRAIAAEGFAFNFFLQFVETLFLLYAVRQLGFSPGMVGAVIGGGSVGALLGSVLAARASASLHFGPAIVLGCIVACASPILLPLASGDGFAAIAISLAVFFLIGFGAGICNVLAVSLRQTVTPRRALGRMNASMRLALYGAIPLGALSGGFLGDRIGLRATLVVGGLGFFLALIPIFLSPIPNLAELPPAADEEPAPAEAKAESEAEEAPPAARGASPASGGDGT